MPELAEQVTYIRPPTGPAVERISAYSIMPTGEWRAELETAVQAALAAHDADRDHRGKLDEAREMLALARALGVRI